MFAVVVRGWILIASRRFLCIQAISEQRKQAEVRATQGCSGEKNQF